MRDAGARRMVLDSFRLNGRVAMVTGGSTGIGVQVARSLVEAGAQLMVIARREDRLRQVASDLGCNYQVCDITDAKQREAVVRATIERLGSLDILVNNAGIASTRPAEDESPDGFRTVLETNLVAAFDLARLAGRHMLERRSGSIINVASVLGLVGVGQIPDAAYSASKGGMISMTRELAAQWARRGVRVNAIAPGYFRSEMTASMFSDDATMHWISRHDPMGRGGEVGELDGAVVFLASDASSYVTGQVLAIDGGWTAV